MTLSVSTGLVSAGQSIAGAAQKIAGISDGYTAANAAFASLKAYDALQQLSSIAKDGGSIASVSLTAGFNYEKSSASASTSTPVVTSVEAGRSVTIEATSGDLTGHGAQITAGYD
ncbi:hemagglutinin repeat-containing protein, partial [Rhizobium sp. Pop5]